MSGSKSEFSLKASVPALPCFSVVATMCYIENFPANVVCGDGLLKSFPRQWVSKVAELIFDTQRTP